MGLKLKGKIKREKKSGKGERYSLLDVPCLQQPSPLRLSGGETMHELRVGLGFRQ